MTVKSISMKKRLAGGSNAGIKLAKVGEPHLKKLKEIINKGGINCNILLEQELKKTSPMLDEFEKHVPVGLFKQEDAKMINKFLNDLASVGNSIVYMLKHGCIKEDHPLVRINMEYISPIFNRLHEIVNKHDGVYKFLKSVKGNNKIFG